jgi:hypothetical protein
MEPMSMPGLRRSVWWEVPAGRVERVVVVGLALLVGWLFYLMVVAGLSQNLMFDGAMNLEVSRSLAEGTGPRRLYDFTDFFPHGVQTKDPYILLGALVFKLLGVGPFTAQLPNLIFLFALCAVTLVIVGRLASITAGLFAVVLLLSMPQIAQYALNGYGEVPTLAFGLAALAVVCWHGDVDRRMLLRASFAGLLAGLALATKAVAAILVVAVAMTLAARVLVESRRRWLNLLGVAAAYAFALALPLVLVELWRWMTLGQAAYMEWWRLEWQGITYQAGVGPAEVTQSRGAKVVRHFQLLVAEIRRSRLATGLLFAVPIGYAACVMFARGAMARARWLVFGLVLVGGCYLVWWMGVTPTEKAWLRRIYIGLACLGTISAIAWGLALRGMLEHSNTAARRILCAALCLSVAVLYAQFVIGALRAPALPAHSEEVKLTLEAAERVRQMDPDDLVFAYGWYAAPTIALHSGREFIDLSDWPIGRYPGHRAYLVADRATFVVGALDSLLARYPHRALMRQNPYVQIYELRFEQPNDPFAATVLDEAPSQMVFSARNDEAVQGMQPFDAGMGGRWMESDAEVLLKYQGQRSLVLHGYMALPSYYRFGVPLQGRVLIPGCPPKPFVFNGVGWQTFELPLEDCQLVPGTTLRIRLLTDNAFDLPLVYNHQRAMVLQKIGFQ